VALGGVNLDLADPSRVSSWQGKAVIGEKRGEQEAFSSDKDIHPSLVRATSETTSPSSKDEMEQYGNILFLPILRSVE
jgi:hypothetical protein